MEADTLNLPTDLTIRNVFSQGNVSLACQKYSILQVKECQSKQILLEKIKFNYSDEGEIQYYPQQFVRSFMLIKLNSLARPECKINQQFLQGFAKFYNSKKQIKIQVSKNECQLFSQIIVQADLILALDSNCLQNIMQGQALLAATVALMINKSKQYLRKCEISFCLTFLALSGRIIAFVHQVHVQKNHKGQVDFADRIFSWADIENPIQHRKIEIQDRRVQDPYSMRCTPQVYGVAFDTLSHVQQHFPSLVNKFHFKNILIDNQQYQNLDLSSDSGVLQGDFLICALNQIGSISFLRCQRILNRYLDSPVNLLNLKKLMERTVHCVSDNKVISTPSNIDTMNLCDYQKDVFFTECKLYQKFNEMMQNLYRILHLEILAGIQGLNNLYHINEGLIFRNNFLKEQFFVLEKNTSLQDKKKSHNFVKFQWKTNL